uniref:HU family DNA-binding protein n=1 Tax=mine drainage metagenome TaxID=410659 RepID=E6QM02_9ZZZZ
MTNSPILPVSIVTLKTLSEDVSDALGMTKKSGHEFAQALSVTIAAALADGCVVSIPGIGRIRPVTREARVGRNPSNGSLLRIPEKRAVKFTVAKPLHDLLNGNDGDAA